VKITVYIDGFNLYYGCLKGTSYKWLDINKLCTFLFPNDEISKIKFFTAPIKIRSYDKDHDAPNRQQVYWRALRTLPNVEIIEGFFLLHQVNMMRADGRGLVQVIKTEEKGTDVNIAAHLLHDAHRGLFEKAVVISNDSDLVSPVKMVREDIGKPVVVISPFERNSIQLKMVATSVKRIREGLLRVSQLPTTLKDSVGDFTMPDKWN
jgi:uncharacterized LabA/DUF88 family protein